MVKIEKKLFLLLALLMAIIVTLSNYLVQFPVNFFGLENLLTYGAFSYPVAFLITDLANRKYGKIIARKIVYIGFILGLVLTLCFSTDFSNLISKRIAIGSGTAFLIAQLLDVQVFDKLRKKEQELAKNEGQEQDYTFFNQGKSFQTLDHLDSTYQEEYNAKYLPLLIENPIYSKLNYE